MVAKYDERNVKIDKFSSFFSTDNARLFAWCCRFSERNYEQIVANNKFAHTQLDAGCASKPWVWVSFTLTHEVLIWNGNDPV